MNPALKPRPLKDFEELYDTAAMDSRKPNSQQTSVSSPNFIQASTQPQGSHIIIDRLWKNSEEDLGPDDGRSSKSTHKTRPRHAAKPRRGNTTTKSSQSSRPLIDNLDVSSSTTSSTLSPLQCWEDEPMHSQPWNPTYAVSAAKYVDGPNQDGLVSEDGLSLLYLDPLSEEKYLSFTCIL